MHNNMLSIRREFDKSTFLNTAFQYIWVCMLSYICTILLFMHLCIYAFNETESFKSVEHAWFWKMASDLEQHDLAARIKEAAHAGKVKYMSKEIAKSDRFKWEDEHFDIMTSLLTEKNKDVNLSTIVY